MIFEIERGNWFLWIDLDINIDHPYTQSQSVILYFLTIDKSIKNVWLFSIKIEFYISLLIVEKLINNT